MCEKLTEHVVFFATRLESQIELSLETNIFVDVLNLTGCALIKVDHS